MFTTGSRRRFGRSARHVGIALVTLAGGLSLLTTSADASSTTFTGKLTAAPITHVVVAGIGTVRATLSTTKGTSATLRMITVGGGVLGTITGADSLELSRTLSGPGAVTFEVTGIRPRPNSRYTLTSTYNSPPPATTQPPPTTVPPTTSTTAPPTTTTTPPATTPPTTTPPTTAPPTTTPPPGDVRVVPASIVSDCSRAVEAELSAWLATVPDGSTIQFGAGRCYGQDDTLFVNDRSNLTFDGNGSTFKALTTGTAGRDNWRVQSGRGITFKNMIVRGANPAAGITDTAYVGAYEWQHAFAFNGTQGGLLDNVQAYDMYGDFVEAQFDLRSYWPEAYPARNIVVRNSRFERSGRQGFGLTWVEGFRLENSYVGDVNMAILDLEPDVSNETITDIVITGNTFGRRRFSILSSAGAGFGDNVGRITFTNNREIGPLYSCRPPIFIEPTPGRTVSNITITDNQLLAYGDTIDLIRVTNVTIARNRSQFSNGQCGRSAGVRLTDSHTINITDNTFTGSSPAVTVDSMSTGITNTNNLTS